MAMPEFVSTVAVRPVPLMNPAHFGKHIAMNPQNRSTLSQILAVAIINIFLAVYGVALGFPVILIPAVSEPDPHSKFHLDEDQISWIGSINLLFIGFGNMFSGIAVDSLGCKKTMLLANIPFLLYCLILTFCNDFWQILVGLSLSGFAGGLVEPGIPGYISEITQPHLRGALLNSTAFAKSLGVSFIFLLGSALRWQNAALVCVIPPIASFCLLFLIPESPARLINCKRLEDARKSLAWVRGWTNFADIEPEFQELSNFLKLRGNSASENTSASTSPIWKMVGIKSNIKNTKKFFKKSFLWPLSIIVFAIFLQYFSGLLSLHYYSSEIFVALQVPVNKYIAPVYLCISELSGFFLGSLLVQYMGKRLLNFTTMLFFATCLGILGVYACVSNIKYLPIDDIAGATLNTPQLNSHNWIPLLFFLLFAFANCCGLQSLMWMLMGEIFQTDTQTAGAAVAITIFNFAGFFIAKITLKLISALTLPGALFLFSGIAVAGVVVLYFILPETEGKTLQEISDHFLGISKLDNKVRRKSTSRGSEEA